MTALAFLAALAAIFVTVLALESDGDHSLALRRPAGILTWLTRGNWPAKIGGTLLIVGLGALLRYALIHIDVAPSVKLTAGIVIALALGFASMFVPDGSARRPVSLALGGAAFAVAYLTAYSAFGLFNYLSNPVGLALLGLTSVAAGVYAVTRSALSLAVLSMIGAFLAPAFAIADPGPQVVYGYYVGASLLTLVMVAQRGWRPLIHLSFLFTLAGGVFFAWTAQYYSGAHTDVMLLMLLILSAVHVAMPIFERQGSQTRWVARLDVIYLVALPGVAVLLAYFIAPNRSYLSTVLVALGAIWAVAAAGLRVAKREGVAAHAVIAALLFAMGVAIRFQDLPWELILLALSAGSLAIAAWQRKPADRLHSVLAGFVVLFGAIHILASTASPTAGPAFQTGTFVERIIGAALLIFAGAICRRIRQSLDTLLLAVGIVWALLAIGIELVRLDLATIALVVHGVLVLLAASTWIPGRRVRIADRQVALLSLAIVGTAAWSASGTLSAPACWASLCAASLALIGLAVRPVMPDGDSREQRATAALLAPVAAAVWAFQAGSASGIEPIQFGFAFAAAVAIAALFVGSRAGGERGDWLDAAVPVFGVAFAGVLAVATLIVIARNPWAVTLEFLCLGGLALIAWLRASRQRSTDLAAAAWIIGAALIVQAHVMRLLGPAGVLDARDILELRWPAVLSLLWAVVGSALTLWSRKVASRSLWIAGATLLVGSAVKLLLHDFGSLGQLANILAVIAAGAVFLLVGWLAPMPPAAPKAPAAPVASRQPAQPKAPAGAAAPWAPATRARTVGIRDGDEAAEGNTAWTIAIVLLAAGALFYFRATTQEFVQRVIFEPSSGSRYEGSAVQQRRNRRERATTDAATTKATTADAGATILDEAPVIELPDESSLPAYTQYSHPAKPVPGQPGIDQLLREGRIRNATSRDVDAWVAATGSDQRSELHLDMTDYRSGGQYIWRTYVVQGEFSYPDGLYGAHSVTFIIPRGVPLPYGNPGHSRVLETP